MNKPTNYGWPQIVDQAICPTERARIADSDSKLNFQSSPEEVWPAKNFFVKESHKALLISLEHLNIIYNSKLFNRVI